MRVIRFSIVLFLCAVSGIGFADYPEIKNLKPTDILFKQMQLDIAAYYKVSFRAKVESYPPLAFFIYTAQKDETLFSIAAELNLPYETIASLNRLSQAGELGQCQELLIPNTPGLFVPLEPVNALEDIMCSRREGDGREGEKVIVSVKGSEEAFLFFRGEKFHAVERAYFLKILFRFPLEHASVSSNFGSRPDPFSGHNSFHNGIDLAAPFGATVYVVREGTVKETGYNDVYGNYVLIAHQGGYETLYGHLSEILVTFAETVKTGHPLGKVGLTGKTTGPHLHFEVRKAGKATDPSTLLPKNTRVEEK